MQIVAKNKRTKHTFKITLFGNNANTKLGINITTMRSIALNLQNIFIFL